MTSTALPPPSSARAPRIAFRTGIGPFRRMPLVVLSELAARGDATAFSVGRQSIVLVSHPDLVHEVLVTQARSFAKGRALQAAKRLLGEGLLTSEGDLHLRQRRLIQPLFHQERVAGYGEAMVRHAERAAERLRDGEIVEVGAEMSRLTLAIVGETLLGADLEGDAADVSAALADAIELFDRLLVPWAGVAMRLPLPGTIRFHRARRRLDAVVGRVIAEHLAEPDGRRDLLSMLLAARDEDEGAMSVRQARDEAMTIFLAGHETTAQALTWTWYLLSENRAAEALLHEELDRVLSGRSPAVGDLPALVYARAVVAESMRLYPPVWTVGRRAVRDVSIGGAAVPAGTIVLASPYVVHRDPRWWPDPERFDPERWTAGAAAERPRYAYFPFGGGSRLCIGERFAWMEATLLLATIAQRRRLRLVPGHPVRPLLRITMRPRHGMRMTVERR